ncbi:Protein of unknown function (DUF3435) domain containing protein [Hyaloscypha variabilis]
MLTADEQIEAALRDGLSTDKSGINSDPVYRGLEEVSIKRYNKMWDFWIAYVDNITELSLENLRKMEDMKHVAEAVARSTRGRLGKRATVKSVRGKMRKLLSIWLRKTNLPIPQDVHDSVAPYIQNELRVMIPLSIEEKAPTFLTIENYVDMEEQLWLRDYHNYVHEGCRVFLSALLKMNCSTAARLQEICKAKYKDLVCMVAWKDEEPEIKIGFKRDFAKGMQNTPKKPKHLLYERLKPTPPLFANGLLFLLAIIISTGGFEHYRTIEDVLAARPRLKRKFLIMDWADGRVDAPVFPEMSADGPTEQPKNEGAWGHQCSDWAKRAGFVDGMGLHAPRREELIKVDDGGYSLGQVMKFAGHRNSTTLVGHYLDDMSNVDGAAAFLNLEPRRDLTEDFRSASMKRDPNLRHSLLTKNREELKQRWDYINLSEQIKDLSVQVTATTTGEACKELTAQRHYLYKQRQKLINKELANYHRTQQRVHTTYYFERVVRHMVPKRDRLARNLPLAVPLRSPEGISALQDLITLLRNDSRCCPVPNCGKVIKDIKHIRGRWKHVYQCSKNYHEKQSGFAEFCFRCSQWILSEIDWEAHCQGHIDNLDLPFRCDPVTFRNATACAGYCIGCLAKRWLPAAKRLYQYPERPSWQEHISGCIPDYIARLPDKGSIPCPHLLCRVSLHSESDLWHHLEDIHSTPKPDVGKKRQRQREENEQAKRQSGAKTKRPRLQGKLEDGDSKAPFVRKSAPKGRSKDVFVNMSTTDFDPSLADVVKMEASRSSSCDSTLDDSVWDQHDDRHGTNTSLLSLSDGILETFPQTGEGCDSPWITPSEEDWILCNRETPLSYLSNTLLVSILVPLATTDLVKDAYRNILTTRLEHIESTMTQPLYGSQGVGGQPITIDAEENIWDPEALLAKWKGRRKTLYLVKWKGFPHEENTFEPPENVGKELMQDFEATWQGNLGVRLLKKRVQKGKVEYLVEWKGCPKNDNSWEKEATISRYVKRDISYINFLLTIDHFEL